MEDTDVYSSSMSHLSQAFPKQRWSCFVKKEILLSPVHFSCDAISGFLDFVLTVLGALRHSTCLPLVSFSRKCSVAVPDFEVRFPLLTTFVNLHHFSFGWGVYVFSLVSAVESFLILTNLNYPQISPEVAARQHMGLVEYSFAGLRSVSHCSGVKMWHF